MTKFSKTDYRGGEALVLSSRVVELTVTASVGPRVVSLRSLASDSPNLFLEIPTKAPRTRGYDFRGGHRLWHSPEHIVRTYQTDDLPLAVKMRRDGVDLTQPVETKTGIEKSIRVELIGPRSVKVTHRLTNRGLWAAECAPWALTMFRRGGYGVVPLLPKGSHVGGDLLPSYSIVPWSYTDLSLPVWDLHRDFIGIDVSKATHAQKLGLTKYPGWSAYWIEGVTFVKFAKVLPSAVYPDRGCCFETFTDGKMIELETLGAFGPLAPGKSFSHVEFWGLLDGLPKPDTDSTFSGKLVPAVQSWFRGLK